MRNVIEYSPVGEVQVQYCIKLIFQNYFMSVLLQNITVVLQHSNLPYISGEYEQLISRHLLISTQISNVCL